MTEADRLRMQLDTEALYSDLLRDQSNEYLRVLEQVLNLAADYGGVNDYEARKEIHRLAYEAIHGEES